MELKNMGKQIDFFENAIYITQPNKLNVHCNFQNCTSESYMCQTFEDVRFIKQTDWVVTNILSDHFCWTSDVSIQSIHIHIQSYCVCGGAFFETYECIQI